MRILFCNFEYPPLGGGGGVINAQLAEALAARHEVTALTSRGPGLAAESVENGVRVVRVPVLMRSQQAAASMASMFSYLPMGIRKGRQMVRSMGFDVINTHFVLPTGPVGDFLARYAKIPNVLSVHGGDLYDPSKSSSPHRHLPLRIWIRRLLKRADRVVGQSRNTLENVHRFYADGLDVLRIPLGIKRPPSGTAARRDYGFTDDQVLLATVGRLVQRKAVEQLISAMKELGPHAQLLILGDGPLRQNLQQQAAESGVAPRIHFLGHVDETDKFSILRMADLFVSTSQHEGFGLVFLEAMACALPVVCYDYGGQTDFLENGVTGNLIRLNDIRMFIESCRHLVANPGQRREMGQRNVDRVEPYFIDRCADRYEEVFAEVIDRNQRRTALGFTHRP